MKTPLKEDPMPSVTEVLSLFGKWDQISPHILTQAASRGSRAHEAIANRLSKKEIVLDLEIEPYYNNFLKWGKENILSSCRLETRFVDTTLAFSGQVDFIGKVKEQEGLVLIDWKCTPYVQATWQLQLAAYCYLAREIGGLDIKHFWVVQVLKKEPNIKIIKYKEDNYQTFNIFKGLLKAYHWMLKKRYKSDVPSSYEFL